MKLRPTIFLSGVSSEFASFRDAAEIEIQKKGCFPLNQPSFGVDYREIEEILRRNLREADAVIHIAGFRFGFEPQNQPPDRPRRSYTQLEYDIARELNIPVYVFLSADASVRDANAGEQPEDEGAVQLQLAHRQALETSNNIRYSIRDKNELCRLVAGIPLLATADFRVDISRIVDYAPAELIGREDELALLNNAWLKVRHSESKRPHILTFVALGGEGKTSLIAKWAAQLAYENWPGCDSAFAWSFYSQGTREQYVASSDLFLKEAITFFGNDSDKEFAASNAGAYEKGQRLARIVGQRRSLVILDGLEPLQYSPASPTSGELKDAGLQGFLKSLSADNDGLCIVTTRYSLPNLKAFWQTTAPEVKLLRLSREAGVHLLQTLGVRGTKKELQTLVEDVRGHALTLDLFGTYLRDAHNGDIRRRDLVKLQEADAEEQSGHAFRVMQAYERTFEEEGDNGKRALAILRLLGLFDRPVTADCLAALLEKPAISDLTDALVRLNEAQRNFALKRLENARLLTINREASGVLLSLDAHPLLREYFARQLRTQQPDAWRAAHRRLYKHLCAITADKTQPTLEDLQPLYQAVVHGCHAGLQQDAYDNVYTIRIRRRNEYYSVQKLGAFGSDLGAIACFFDLPWRQLAPRLSKNAQARLPNQAAFYLRALGRLSDALEPMRLGLATDVRYQDWHNAAISSNNLSELELKLGEVNRAVKAAEESVTYADRSGDAWLRIGRRVALANAKQHFGLFEEAHTDFSEAETMFKREANNSDSLVGTWGFYYCEFILALAERAAWQCVHESSVRSRNSELESICRTVEQRAAKMLQWAKQTDAAILEIALAHLTVGRAALCEAILSSHSSEPEEVHSGQSEGRSRAPDGDQSLSTSAAVEIGIAVDHLRRSGKMDELPRGLLTRAWLRFLSGVHTGVESAQEDLDEAWEIAERGPMKLHMADIHLYRARLFFREAEYPWASPRKDLEEAERLINECGYHRRDEELADAKQVILNNPR